LARVTREAAPGRIAPLCGATGHDWPELPVIALPLGGEPLSLDQTLASGQAFRWWPLGTEQWEGIAGHHVWRLRLDGDRLLAQAAPEMPPERAAAFLSHYFCLDLPVAAIQDGIVAADPRTAEAVRGFAGLRILRQDPTETVLTFTIATATNVPRVTRSVRELCRRFGTLVAVVDGVAYHDFPTIDQVLAAPTDELFGPCNLAYRARAIQAVAGVLKQRPPGWLDDQRKMPYVEAHRALDDLPSYGPKVSDCACLFGLGFGEAVPVDVHVWAIAHELYGEEISTRTLTARTYQKIGDRFRAVFGVWAGWAQQYLFCARRAVPINRRFRPRASASTRAQGRIR
jgi:N-glycosylase/DNA lyase